MSKKLRAMAINNTLLFATNKITREVYNSNLMFLMSLEITEDFSRGFEI